MSPRRAEQAQSVAIAAPDLAACRASLRTGSLSFAAAARLLPARVRDPAIALYAFCRLADDAIDQGGGQALALAQLRARLDRAYAGRPFPTPADRALAATLTHFAIPPALPEALLEGLAWDAEGRRYETLAALTAYAMRVAGSVGMMMALVMGARTPMALARAADLGVAMQFSNIARDIAEDARAGRVYLPQQWLREANIDLARPPELWLADRDTAGALAGVVGRLLAVAEGLYRRADSGIALLPRLCRPGIRAARLLYAEIGHEVTRRGAAGLGARAVVSRRRKLWVLCRGLAARPATIDAADPLRAARFLPAARFLIDAVTATTIGSSMPEAPQRPLGEQVVWVAELFARLAEREQSRAASMVRDGVA